MNRDKQKQKDGVELRVKQNDPQDQSDNDNDQNNQNDQEEITRETIGTIPYPRLLKLARTQLGITVSPRPTKVNLIASIALKLNWPVGEVLVELDLVNNKEEKNEQDNKELSGQSSNKRVQEDKEKQALKETVSKQQDELNLLKAQVQSLINLQAQRQNQPATSPRAASVPLAPDNYVLQPQALPFVPRSNIAAEQEEKHLREEKTDDTTSGTNNNTDRFTENLVTKALCANATIKAKLSNEDSYRNWKKEVDRIKKTLKIPIIIRYQCIKSSLLGYADTYANQIEKKLLKARNFYTLQDSEKEEILEKLIIRLTYQFSGVFKKLTKAHVDFKKFVWRGTGKTRIYGRDKNMQQFLFEFQMLIEQYQEHIEVANAILEEFKDDVDTILPEIEDIDEKKQFAQLWGKISQEIKKDMKVCINKDWPRNIKQAIAFCGAYATYERDIIIQRINAAANNADKAPYDDTRRKHDRYNKQDKYGKEKYGKHRKQRKYYENKSKEDYNCTICQMDNHTTEKCAFNKENPQNVLDDPLKMKRFYERKKQRLEKRKQNWHRNKNFKKEEKTSKDTNSKNKKQVNTLEKSEQKEEKNDSSVEAALNSIDLDIAEIAENLKQYDVKMNLCMLEVLPDDEQIYPEENLSDADGVGFEATEAYLAEFRHVENKRKTRSITISFEEPRRRSIPEVLSDISEDTDCASVTTIGENDRIHFRSKRVTKEVLRNDEQESLSSGAEESTLVQTPQRKQKKRKRQRGRRKNGKNHNNLKESHQHTTAPNSNSRSTRNAEEPDPNDYSSEKSSTGINTPQKRSRSRSRI